MKIPDLVERLRAEIATLESQVAKEVYAKAKAQQEVQEQIERAQAAEGIAQRLAKERAQLALLVVKLLPGG